MLNYSVAELRIYRNSRSKLAGTNEFAEQIQKVF